MRLKNIRIFGATLLGAAAIFVIGILSWGGFNTAMEETNTMDFCISCHEMHDNVYQEYKQTVHYQNRSGVRASCSDCHVPDPWIYKVARKIQATNELYHWALGTIDTPEKFEANRLTLAKHVWKAMKETDSRECRNCHSWGAMLEGKQKRRAWKQHQLARDEGQTCIDCHKGIAHRPVHVLLEEGDDPYDGQADTRALEVLVAGAMPMAEAAAEPTKVTESAPKPPEAAAAPEPTTSEITEDTQVAAAEPGGADWSAVAGRPVALFYPGQASLEWVLKGSDHGGARAVTKIGDRCAECHEGEQADMGAKIVTGEKVETTVIPGKRPAIEAELKAAYDADNLYLQVTWPDGPHSPAPFVEGGKMDPENQIKLAVMIIGEENEFATQVGCWATCHHDSRYMPDQPEQSAISAELTERLAAHDGITKYLRESRSDLEIRGSDGKPRGGWDKLLPPEKVESLMEGGLFVDLIRFKSGNGTTENGFVLEDRVADGGATVEGSGVLADGVWTVELTIPLTGGPGDIALDPAKIYTIGLAIHDDHTAARFHHVSLEYRLGFDNAEAEVNAVKR
ncbi:MAG: NapC/NirT family cytochrome c [Pseudomonadota bacterium]